MTLKQLIMRDFLLFLADNTQILGHRLGEWCGHGPELEIDMAMTNLALDLIGQSRNYYQYAAELEGAGRTEDDLAYLRDAREFRNCLLVEQPNGDFAHTVARNFLFDSWHFFFLQSLIRSTDERLSAIAVKSLKEVSYHLRWSSEWVIRLGDGTEESHRRIQEAFDHLWTFRGELLSPAPFETDAASAGYGVDLHAIKPLVEEKLADILYQATLKRPEDGWMQSGGKTGRHSEHLGYLLAEMQYVQRAYPNSVW